MAYTEVGSWVAGGAPAINATNLDTIETQYSEAISEVFDGDGIGPLPMSRILRGTDKLFLRATGAGTSPEYAATLSNTIDAGYFTYLGNRQLATPLELA